MKKFLALMMALVLLLSCTTALAQETQAYTHPNQGYSFQAPANWLVVDSTNIQTYIDAFRNGEMAFKGTDATTLEGQLAQILSTDCVVVIDEYANNVVINGTDMGMEVTTDLFLTVFVPLLKSQLTEQIPSIQFVTDGEVVKYGENEFILLKAQYDMQGVAINVEQLYYIQGTVMYVANLTVIPLYEDAILDAFYAGVETMMASYAVAQ